MADVINLRMCINLSVEDRKEAKEFIAETKALGIPWVQLVQNGRIVTKALGVPGESPYGPIEGRYLKDVGRVVGVAAAADHYGLSEVVKMALLAAADRAPGYNPELRQLMLGLVPQAAI